MLRVLLQKRRAGTDHRHFKAVRFQQFRGSYCIVTLLFGHAYDAINGPLPVYVTAIIHHTDYMYSRKVSYFAGEVKRRLTRFQLAAAAAAVYLDQNGYRITGDSKFREFFSTFDTAYNSFISAILRSCLRCLELILSDQRICDKNICYAAFLP